MVLAGVVYSNAHPALAAAMPSDVTPSVVEQGSVPIGEAPAES
jgi:hypothetical protein